MTNPNAPENFPESKYPYTFEPKAMLRLTRLGMMALKALDRARVDRIAARGAANPEIIAEHFSSRIRPGNIVALTEHELADTLGPLLGNNPALLIESEVSPEPPIMPPSGS